MQAAVSGVIDFHKARLRDPRWWKRCDILLRGLERELDHREYRIGYDLTLSQLSNSNLTPESFKKTQELAQKIYQALQDSLKPWAKRQAQDQWRKTFAGYRQMYIDMVGVDPTDPAFKAWEAQHLAASEARDAQAQAETPEAVIARRAAERQQRREARKR